MRNPVKDPGPETAAKAPMSALLNLCLASKAAICGTSSAENVPPESAATSMTSQASPGPHCASAMLPCFPEVSTARRSMNENCDAQIRANSAKIRGRLYQCAASTNSSSTPPALEGCTNT